MEIVLMVCTLTSILTTWLLKTQFTHLACTPQHKVSNESTRSTLLYQISVDLAQLCLQQRQQLIT